MSRSDEQAAGRGRAAGSPGADLESFIYTDAPPTGSVSITTISYDESYLDEQIQVRPEDLLDLIRRSTVTWIDLNGVHDSGLIQALGDALGLHPLTLEDIENTRQRPKIEDYGDYLYVAIWMLLPGRDGRFRSEQVSLVLGKAYVITFREQPGDPFYRIRERLHEGTGRFRTMGADYLFYSLLDTIIDGYFAVIEIFSDHIEDIEEEVITEPDQETLQVIYALKRSLIALRRIVWPLRDVVVELERGESSLIGDMTIAYFRDAYDHTIEVAETMETYREMMSGTLDVYLSSQSSHMNEIMKILTIIATIFIPLTFITGIYGMNFAYMPGIAHPLGYPAAIISMIIVAIVMLIFFRRKGWI